MLQPGCLFVGIGHFDDSSNTDRLMKSKLRASFPPNYTKSDTRTSHCQSSDSWMLVSLLPDLEVNDLEKCQSNQRSKYWLESLNAEYKYTEHSFVVQCQATQGKIITIDL